MPRALDPRQRFPIVLDSDKGQEPECTFWFKNLTGAEFMQVDEAASRTKDAASDYEFCSAVYSALRIGLVDWSHLTDRDGNPVPFRPADLECVIGIDEATELLAKMKLASMFGVQDSKKSESRSASGAESSADSVGAGATTSQATTSPSRSSVPSAKGKGAKPVMADISA